MYFLSKKKGRGGVLVSNCAKQKLYNHSVCVDRGRTENFVGQGKIYPTSRAEYIYEVISEGKSYKFYKNVFWLVMFK